MIRREDVADLKPGDVVEISGYSVLKDASLRGPLHKGDGQTLSVGPLTVRRSDGRPQGQWDGGPEHFLTVVSRAPRPFYVNHDRTEPVAGDVVREEIGDKMALFICTGEPDDVWWVDTAADWISPAEMREKRLRLLVDGETGEAVP